MTRPRLHLDADASNAALADALVKRGHDVTRTPNGWIALDASDTEQLLASTAQGRCIFTFNVRDFIPLANLYPNHAGIVVSRQRPMPQLLEALDCLLSELQAEDLAGQVRWLSDWMK
ncbi:MAG: DUF5615 family PIN-like protein [Chloroflexota bacterium]